MYVTVCDLITRRKGGSEIKCLTCKSVDIAYDSNCQIHARNKQAEYLLEVVESGAKSIGVFNHLE